jgi:hypothetical protein
VGDMAPPKSETILKNLTKHFNHFVTSLFFIGEKSLESDGRKCLAKSIKGKRGKNKIK